MVLPLDIEISGNGDRTTIEATVREHAARLEKFFPRIQRCRVVVDAAMSRAPGQLISA